MTNAHRPRMNATLVLASGVLVLLAVALLGLASTARAAEPTGYGELTRFGEPGGFVGHLAPGYLRERAIGVDSSDNSVYLLDEPKEPAGKSRVLRLQKYTANGSGEYALTASVEFKEGAPEVENTEPAVEGLAIDPSAKRVYLLTALGREKKLKDASRTPGGTGVLVASTLYTYSTVASGGKLIPATGPGVKAEGVVIGPEELKAQSETPGEALLQPRGITVDPASGEVIVLAHEDKGTEQVDNPRNALDHYVLARITSEGKLAARYVDGSNVFKQEGAGGNRFPVPDSPVVVSAGGKEHVYVNYSGLAEVPYEFSSSTPPRVTPGPEIGVAAGIGSYPQGGGLTASEGTIYGASTSGIKNEEPGGEQRGGVIAYSGETAAEIGWTGGGAKVACTVSPLNFSLAPVIAAGAGGKVFALAPEFLLREQEGEPEVEEIEVENPETHEKETEVIERPTFEALSGPFSPAVVEFGPGGAGCPQATVTPLVAKVNNAEVKAEESIKVGSEAIFSSQLKQADALKVEWDFGDGATETVATDEYQSTSAKHRYTKEGTFAVTEKIYSDDFAAPGQAVFGGGQLTTPTITVTRSIVVGAQPPKAQFSGPATVAVGASAQFTNVSSDPNGSEGLPLKYAWDFGDGGTSTETSPPHTYAKAGTYTVMLTATDKLGKTSSASHTITVASPPPPAPPPPAPAPAGGGGGTGGGSRTSATATTTPTLGAAGGVLSYTVRLASATLSVSKTGALVLEVECAGASSCTGNAVLRTASAVSSGAHKHKAIMTLASGSFAIAGGQLKSLSLHLTAKARALLVHLHGVLRAKVSVVARDVAGVTHTTTFSVTLRAAKHH